MRVIIGFFFFLFLFGYILRLLFPYILKWYMRRMQNKINKEFGVKTEKPKKKKEGQIRVEQTQPNDKKIDKDVGDYVDFEETK